MKKIFILLMMALATCNISAKSNFVQVKDGHFVRDGKPYYYVGTNFWYGAIPQGRDEVLQDEGDLSLIKRECISTN